MAEKKKDERTTARTEVEKALVKALSDDMGEIPEVSITVEELKQLAAADKKKRKKRAAKYASVAAVAVIVCAAVVFMAWPETVVPVDADKNTEQRVETGDGEIVINEGDGIGESGITEITETDWEKVKKCKSFVHQLIIPGFIPGEYAFQKLKIEKYNHDGFWAQYAYKKNDDQLFIEQREYNEKGANTGGIENVTETITSKLGKVYLSTEEKKIIASVYTDKGIIRIKGDINRDEALKIIEELEMP